MYALQVKKLPNFLTWSVARRASGKDSPHSQQVYLIGLRPQIKKLPNFLTYKPAAPDCRATAP